MTPRDQASSLWDGAAPRSDSGDLYKSVPPDKLFLLKVGEEYFPRRLPLEGDGKKDEEDGDGAGMQKPKSTNFNS